MSEVVRYRPMTGQCWVDWWPSDHTIEWRPLDPILLMVTREILLQDLREPYIKDIDKIMYDLTHADEGDIYMSFSKWTGEMGVMTKMSTSFIWGGPYSIWSHLCYMTREYRLEMAVKDEELREVVEI